MFLLNDKNGVKLIRQKFFPKIRYIVPEKVTIRLQIAKNLQKKYQKFTKFFGDLFP